MPIEQPDSADATTAAGNRHAKTTKRYISPMTLASWTMLIVIWTGAFFALFYMRKAAFLQAETDIDNLTRAIAAESDVIFRSAESILFDARQIVEDDDALNQEKLDNLLGTKHTRVPFLRALIVTDPNGNLRYITSGPDRPAAINFADRQWFTDSRDSRDRAMAIALPVHSRIAGGTWVIPLSMRLEGPGGQFRGVVLAALDPAFFNALFANLDLGVGSTIILQRSDSSILWRRPLDDSQLGKPVLNGPVHQMLQGRLGGIVRTRSVFTGDARVMGGRVVEGFSAYISITRTEASILTVWRAQLVIIVGNALVISLLLFATMRQSETTARLASEQDAVKALVDASPRALAVLRRDDDMDFTIIRANRPFAQMIGKPETEIRDKPILAMLSGLTDRPIPKTIDEVSGSSFEIALSSDDGAIDAQLLFTPVKGRMDSLGTILVTAINLTARKSANRKEADRHMLEALGRMSGRIAHEINNVLQPILSHASLALHASPDNPTAQAHLKEIQSGVRNGREIVRSVLTLAGTKALNRKATSLESAILEALDLIKPSLPERITLDLLLAAPDAQVSLATGEMFQILGNLIGNAVDAIENDGKITIQTDHCEIDLMDASLLGIPSGSYYQILIRDNGSGMDSATLRSALDPFFTTKPFGVGVGLGLSTVGAIIGGLHGSISLLSQSGKGTTVRILLPTQEML